jgi:hypothetical protein
MVSARTRSSREECYPTETHPCIPKLLYCTDNFKKRKIFVKIFSHDKQSGMAPSIVFAKDKLFLPRQNKTAQSRGS